MPLNYSKFPSYDFTMFIKGDSMSPKFESGDEIACRRIEPIPFYSMGESTCLGYNARICYKKSV